MRAGRDARFLLACGALLILGGLMRYFSGWLTLPWQQSAGPGAAAGADVPAELRAAIMDFYGAVDRGQYGEAYNLALENQWSRQGEGYASVGLTNEADFVAECNTEMGNNGADLSILNIDILSVQPVPSGQTNAALRAELLTLDHLPAGSQVEHLYIAQVGGSMLEHCSPWDWHKEIVVVRINDLGWRVLLPGSPGPEPARIAEWFLDEDVWAGKQIVREEVSR